MWISFRLQRKDILLGSLIPSFIVAILIPFFVPEPLEIKLVYGLFTFVLSSIIMLGIISLATVFSTNVKVNLEQERIRLGKIETNLTSIISIETIISWRNGRPSVELNFYDGSGNKGKLFVPSVPIKAEVIVNMISQMDSVPSQGRGSSSLSNAPRRQVVSRDVAIEMVNELNMYYNRKRISPV